MHFSLYKKTLRHVWGQKYYSLTLCGLATLAIAAGLHYFCIL